MCLREMCATCQFVRRGPLVLHKHPSHCEFFHRAVFSSCVACIIYHPILSSLVTNYLAV